jgi:hypothetical protein
MEKNISKHKVVDKQSKVRQTQESPLILEVIWHTIKQVLMQNWRNLRTEEGQEKTTSKTVNSPDQPS